MARFFSCHVLRFVGAPLALILVAAGCAIANSRVETSYHASGKKFTSAHDLNLVARGEGSVIDMLGHSRATTSGAFVSEIYPATSETFLAIKLNLKGPLGEEPREANCVIHFFHYEAKDERLDTWIAENWPCTARKVGNSIGVEFSSSVAVTTYKVENNHWKSLEQNSIIAEHPDASEFLIKGKALAPIDEVEYGILWGRLSSFRAPARWGLWGETESPAP